MGRVRRETKMYGSLKTFCDSQTGEPIFMNIVMTLISLVIFVACLLFGISVEGAWRGVAGLFITGAVIIAVCATDSDDSVIRVALWVIAGISFGYVVTHVWPLPPTTIIVLTSAISTAMLVYYDDHMKTAARILSGLGLFPAVAVFALVDSLLGWAAALGISAAALALQTLSANFFYRHREHVYPQRTVCG
jgi:hypothetical protein